MREIVEARAEALEQLEHDPIYLGIGVAKQPKPLAALKLQHWRCYQDAEKVVWAILDREGSSANTLSEPVFREFETLLDVVVKMQPTALVFRSAKKSGFIMGAEISEFVDMTEDARVKEMLEHALGVLDRLERVPFPTIAAVHGFCLGGGLEFALACKYRICTDTARFGFPEVLLGLHPGLAGTWRTLKLADADKGVEMMLSGRTLYAKQAKNMGIVDAMTQERHMAEAIDWAIKGKLKVRRELTTKGKAMTFGPARSLIAMQMEKEVAKKAKRQHYPAPYAMIELWREHGGDLRDMRKAETESFARLMTGDTSKNLVRAFFLREGLKENGKGTEHQIKHVHVIGAGVMGGDIAAWSALRGYKVTLQDMKPDLIAPAIKRARKLFKRRLRRPGDATAAMDRLIPDLAGNGARKADLIIEAVTERPEIKKLVYAQCEERMKPGTLLATNTSSILLETLAEGLKAPQNFVGIHFFNPVAKMPLVEVVTHDKLDETVLARTMAWVADIDKLPLAVKSLPGFLVNRTLTPYMMEAFIAMDEGIKPEVIDAAAEEFGMPMGPIELADQVGLDVAMHVAKVLKDDLGDTFPDIPHWFDRKVKAGNLGKKTGKGIYQFDKNGKPDKQDVEDAPDEELQDRLILPLLNACVACLRKGVITDKDQCDGGIIFGTGFAPFRGGPMNYIARRGAKDIVDQLERLARRHGDRFLPDPGWDDLLDE
ncbi:MAG: 3-hydroxyacyl-CoA dehydrogenase NAD-binding domain-containing protein [Pseudomonadota bacterium]